MSCRYRSGSSLSNNGGSSNKALKRSAADCWSWFGFFLSRWVLLVVDIRIRPFCQQSRLRFGWTVQKPTQRHASSANGLLSFWSASDSRAIAQKKNTASKDEQLLRRLN